MQLKVWRLLIAPLALLLLASPTLAQGVVDQENDPTPTTAVGCDSTPILTKTVGQTFVPDEDSLVAVALRLRTGADFTDGTEATVRILDADGSTVVNDVTAAIEGSTDASGALVLFEFEEVEVTPGDTYLIQLDTPSTAIFTWAASTAGASTDPGPYADGNIKSCSGNDWPIGNMDCNFITYAAAEVVVATATLTCEERLEILLAHVDDVGLGKWRARRLSWPLKLAGMMLDAGRARSALLMVRVFMVNAKYTLRWMAADAAKALVAEAEELAQCIVDEHDITFKRRWTKRWGY